MTKIDEIKSLEKKPGLLKSAVMHQLYGQYTNVWTKSQFLHITPRSGGFSSKIIDDILNHMKKNGWKVHQTIKSLSPKTVLIKNGLESRVGKFKIVMGLPEAESYFMPEHPIKRRRRRAYKP